MDQKNSCVRADGSEKSRVQAEDAQKSCGRESPCVGVWKNGGAEIIANKQRNRICQDADVKLIVRDPTGDDRIPVVSGAEMTPVPHEPSEFEKLKHQLTHIPFQPWCTSCFKGKAQAEPHKRTERIIEDSELTVIHCDVERRCGHKWTESAKHVRENIWVWHVHSSRHERPNRHVRNNVGSENVEFRVILSHRSSSGQKVSSPNDQNEQSFDVLPEQRRS